jgi:ribonuclease Y
MLNIDNKNDELCNYIGRLKYRWSFSQNVLQHCYETAIICEKLALEFGLNSQLAKEIGFFHDIGKAIDYEESFDHIKSGIQIAKKCNLKQIIIDTIAKHHQTTCNEDYVLLVKCADAWSAARNGARHTVENNDQQLLEIIKDKLKSISNIAKYKIEINDKTINIIFLPKINTIEMQKITKYDIYKTFKKDARLKKYSLNLFCE